MNAYFAILLQDSTLFPRKSAMRPLTSFLLFLTSLAISVSAGEPGAKLGEVEIFPGEHWQAASDDFLSAQWNAEKLAEAEARWKALVDKGQSTGLMIVHKGYVVREFGDCETPVPCHSVRKSFLSAIYGAWIEGQETSIDELLSKRIGEIPLTEIDGIPEIYQGATIRHLLQSSSGNPAPAEYESSDNFAKRTKKPPVAPGERWAYSNWDFNALGTVFNKISDGDLFQVFDEKIAGPVKMQDFRRSEHTKYFPGEGAKRKSLHPAYLFRMSTRDRARFGLLYLAGGMWGDQRVIDEEWFKRSITDTVPAKDGTIDYGYMWWVGVNGQKLYPFPGDRTYSARGNGGQYIFVIPSRDLVVVHSRDTRRKDGGTDFDGALLNELLRSICDAQRGILSRDPAAFVEKCESLVPQLQRDLNVPGVSMALIDGGKVMWSREFGIRDVTSGEPVTAKTRFEAASTSKPLYAYAVMKLVEEGKLDLDEPLANYLEDAYMEGDDRHLKITARMVFSHRSGFPNWRKGGISQNPDPPLLGFDPGTQQRYSGEGFTLLQTAVEAITGMNIDQFTQEKLLKPMAMSESRYVWDPEAEIAAAHNSDGTFRRSNPRYFSGNSAYTLFTTPTDYAKFLIEIMKADRSASHSISDKTRAEMLRPHSSPEDKRNFALSWVIRPEQQGGYSHTGSNRGFRCGAWFDPELNRGLVIMTNSSSGELLRDRIFTEALGSWE